MDLLSRLERALEGVVEGVFTRAFRAPLQPVEIAKRLTREVENHRSVSVHATYVPNVYIVHLAPETYSSFQSISGRLLGELEQYLREFTAERGYETVGPIAVQLARGDDMKGGEVEISVASDAAAEPSAAPTPSVLRSYASRADNTREKEQPREAAVAPATSIEVVSGEGAGRHLPLTDALTIGRGPANTLAFTDPGVSRHHAEIVWQDEHWVIRDLGSTNGTIINDRRTATHQLRAGDTIKVGANELRIR